MRLLYCYAKFYDRQGKPKALRGLDSIELNFSTTDVFRYDELNNTLRKNPRETPLPENFWANGTAKTNIYNVNVIAGVNGSGKTTARSVRIPESAPV